MRFLNRHKRLNLFFAVLMTGSFFLATTPHAFIHELTGHKDTVDVYGKNASLNKQHVHCKFLQIAVTPYLAGEYVHTPSQAVQHILLYSQAPALHPVLSLPLSFLRGPPAEA